MENAESHHLKNTFVPGAATDGLEHRAARKKEKQEGENSHEGRHLESKLVIEPRLGCGGRNIGSEGNYSDRDVDGKENSDIAIAPKRNSVNHCANHNEHNQDEIPSRGRPVHSLD